MHTRKHKSDRKREFISRLLSRSCSMNAVYESLWVTQEHVESFNLTELNDWKCRKQKVKEVRIDAAAMTGRIFVLTFEFQPDFRAEWRKTCFSCGLWDLLSQTHSHCTQFRQLFLLYKSIFAFGSKRMRTNSRDRRRHCRLERTS